MMSLRAVARRHLGSSTVVNAKTAVHIRNVNTIQSKFVPGKKPVIGGAPLPLIHERVRTPLELILALDIEATCERPEEETYVEESIEKTTGEQQEQVATTERNRKKWVHEIIEFPVVALNTRTLQIEREFHRFVRPTEQPVLTPFCTELTGIRQEDVADANTIDVVAVELRDWLLHDLQCISKDGTPTRSFAFASDGPWDIHCFIRSEFERKGIVFPPSMNTWIDVRRSFQQHHRLAQTVNLRHMLAKSGMPFVGRAHSGIADTRNLVSVIRSLLFARFPLNVNDSLEDDNPAKRMYE